MGSFGIVLLVCFLVADRESRYTHEQEVYFREVGITVEAIPDGK